MNKIVLRRSMEFVERIDELCNFDGQIIIEGHLSCSKGRISKLPNNLTVKGNLHCYSSGLPKLPDNLTVTGSLFCFDNKLIELPDTLTVNVDVYCGSNYITHEIKSTIDGSIYMGDKQQIMYDRVIKIRKLLNR